MLHFSICLATATIPSVISQIIYEGKSALPKLFAPMPFRDKQVASAFLHLQIIPSLIFIFYFHTNTVVSGKGGLFLGEKT
jgi:hypothetical protein